LSHKTGHGYVKAHRGFYHVHDAIFVKRNNFNLLLHETFGGGFSPTAVLKLRRFGIETPAEFETCAAPADLPLTDLTRL